MARVFSAFHPRAKNLCRRLDDIADYSSGPGLFPQNNVARSASGFNGRVVYAAHSLGYFHPSGYAARTAALLNSLKACGVDVYGFVRPGYPSDIGRHALLPENNQAEDSGIRFQLAPDSPFKIRSCESEYIDGYAGALQDFTRRAQVSAVHAASNYLNGSAAALAGLQLGIASVYEVRGLWHLTRAFSYPAYYGSDHFRYCEKREVDACRGVDHVITLSDGLKGWLVERGIPAGKISVVGNAAFPRSFNEEVVDDQVALLRRQYQLESWRSVVGYLGSLVEYEGLDRLITLLARSTPCVRPFLLIVGDGKARKGLVKLAEKRGN